MDQGGTEHSQCLGAGLSGVLLLGPARNGAGAHKEGCGNFWNNPASAYAEEGDYVGTLRTLEKQMQVAGSNQDYLVWYNLGNGLATVAASTRVGNKAGKPSDAVLQEAINAYNQALRLNPRYGNAWNNLGVAEEGLGDRQDALKCYQRVALSAMSTAVRNYTDLAKQNRRGSCRASSSG